MITEGLMATGTFDVRLRDDTPWTIRRRLDTWGYICVTPGELPYDTLDVPDVLAAAQYTGFIDSIGDDLTMIEGRGLMAVLGDSLRGRRDSGAPSTSGFETWWSFGSSAFWAIVNLFSIRTSGHGNLVPVPSSGSNNGVSLGAVYPTVASPPWVTTVSDYVHLTTSSRGFISPHARDVIDFAFANVGPVTSMEWRLNADGTWDHEQPSKLFASGDVMFSEEIGDVDGIDGSGGLVRGVQVAESQIVSIDGREMTTGWYVNSPNSDQTTPGSPGWYSNLSTNSTTRYALDGTTMALHGARNVGDPDIAAVDLEVIADDVQALHESPRQTISITIEGRDVRSLVECGDSVYIYDSMRGLVDVSNTVIAAGLPYRPKLARVWQMEVPISAGKGVYYIIPTTSGTGADRVIDLTHYVESEDDVTTITLGNRPVNVFTP